jgi:hypothetical protein
MSTHNGMEIADFNIKFLHTLTVVHLLNNYSAGEVIISPPLTKETQIYKLLAK